MSAFATRLPALPTGSFLRVTTLVIARAKISHDIDVKFTTEPEVQPRRPLLDSS